VTAQYAICSAVCLATVDLYAKQVNLRRNLIRYTAKNEYKTLSAHL
jgi:hypothetical protein